MLRRKRRNDSGQGEQILPGRAAGATGHHKRQGRRKAMETADRLAGVGHGIGRDGACVEQGDVGSRGIVRFPATVTQPCFPHSLRFVLVHLAAEGEEKKAPVRAHGSESITTTHL